MNWKYFKQAYSVSREGVVTRTIPATDVHCKTTYIGKILKQKVNRCGYSGVFLVYNKQKRHFFVHRLVALEYIPNPNNLPQVNHKNGIKSDNRVENLEWCDASYNMRHSYDALGRKALQGEDCRMAKLTEEQVKEIRNLVAQGKWKFGMGAHYARMFGVYRKTISRIISRKTWKYV